MSSGMIDPVLYRDMPLTFEPNEQQRRCLTVLARWQAPHNMRHSLTKAGIMPCGPNGIEARIHGELATYDAPVLTSLVVAAHQWRVRLSVQGRSNGILTVLLHARQPPAPGLLVWDRHPGPEHLSDMADLYAIYVAP